MQTDPSGTPGFRFSLANEEATRRLAADVANTLEPGDFIALDREMAPVGEGDLLAVLGAGAYGFAMSSNYNSRPRAVEVLVEEGRWGVIGPSRRGTARRCSGGTMSTKLIWPVRRCRQQSEELAHAGGHHRARFDR